MSDSERLRHRRQRERDVVVPRPDSTRQQYSDADLARPAAGEPTRGRPKREPRVQAQLVTCPSCGDDRYRVRKTSRISDALGTVRTSWRRCIACDTAYVAEFIE